MKKLFPLFITISLLQPCFADYNEDKEKRYQEYLKQRSEKREFAERYNAELREKRQKNSKISDYPEPSIPDINTIDMEHMRFVKEKCAAYADSIAKKTQNGDVLGVARDEAYRECWQEENNRPSQHYSKEEAAMLAAIIRQKNAKRGECEEIAWRKSSQLVTSHDPNRFKAIDANELKRQECLKAVDNE